MGAEPSYIFIFASNSGAGKVITNCAATTTAKRSPSRVAAPEYGGKVVFACRRGARFRDEEKMTSFCSAGLQPYCSPIFDLRCLFCGKRNLHKLEFLLPMRWAAMRPSFPSFFFISLSRTRIFCPLLCRRLPQGRYQNAVFLLPASLWPRASCSHKSAKVVPPSHVAHFDSSFRQCQGN